VAFWSACRLAHRENLALHYLEEVAGFTVYHPRLRDRRIRHGRRVELRPALFPGYAFVLIRLQQWYAARWAPGTLGLIMDGVGPAKVPDAVIAEIRRRTLTRSARSANSSNGAACGCSAMMRPRVGSKYPMRMNIAFSAPSWRLLFITLLGGAAAAWPQARRR